MRVLILHDRVTTVDGPDGRDVLDQAAAVAGALTTLGHTVDRLDCDLDLAALATELRQRQPELVFNLVESLAGSGRLIHLVPACLETLGVPYTGCGVMASAIGKDKYRTKLVWQGLGLPVPEFAVLHDNSDFAAIERELGLPLFVKPAVEGSSVGVVKVKEAGSLKAAYQSVKHLHGEILAERFIGGGEYTCAVLNGQALPSIHIIPATEFYDYEAKYNRDDTVYQCPSDLNEADEALMRSLSVRAFAAIGGQGWGRVDFLKDTDGKLYLLEVNTLPGMTGHSLVPKAAAQSGLSFADLCVEILKTAHVG